MTDLSTDLKTVLLSMFCAALDGRDTRHYVLELTTGDCVRAHNMLKRMDDQLKEQWIVMGGRAEHGDGVIL